MKLKILICDDDIEFVKRINKDISDYFNNKYDLETVVITHNFDSIEYHNCDMIFIDIDLAYDKYNGITLAGILKNHNPDSLIIFMSNRSELVFDTLQVGIFQFIRKDHYDTDFPLIIRQVIHYIDNKDPYVLIDINGRLTKICQSHIIYIMSIGNDITIFTDSKEYTYKSTMKNVLETLGFKHIVQIQKTLSINLEHLEDFTKWKVIIHSKEYKIGRIYQKQFYKEYREYLINSNK